MPFGERIGLRLMPAWQRVKFDYSSFYPGISYAQATTANRWELPVVADWNLGNHVRPGLGGVVSVVSAERTLSRGDVAPGFGTPDGYTNLFRVDTLSRRTVAGLVADVEFPFRGHFGTIAPDVRYTRWLSKHFGNSGRLDTLSLGLSLRF